MDEELIRFVDHARDKGMDHATIRQLLTSAGWNEKDVAEVICTRDLDLAIPQPTKTGPAPMRSARRSPSPWPRRAREAFLHLLTFGALFTWAGNVIFLFFSCINFALPDPAWRISQSVTDETVSAMRGALASLIVAFPLFLILWHFLLREVHRDPDKAKGAIRRWLLYLTLFVGAITLAGDVMTLIYFLLEGQLTLRLVLKAAVLFLIAGSLVLYLAFTLRSETDTAR
ncbi:MAG: hypothetical protein GY716_19315 [bacterium]|nr:hypothetical protein [bacterium]